MTNRKLITGILLAVPLSVLSIAIAAYFSFRAQASAITSDLYDGMIQTSGYVDRSLCSDDVAATFAKATADFGPVIDYKIKRANVKLDNLWEVIVSVRRERSRTTETLMNMHKGRYVARVHIKGDP